jgi:hypothetical protein
VFLFELKDLPGMIKYAGSALKGLKKPIPPSTRDAIQRAGGANLQWQFGWAPLISDLTKLLDFQSHVAKRRNELDRLYNKGGLRRRVQVGEVSVSAKTSSTIFHTGPTVTGHTVTTTECKRWATVRWRPRSSIIPSVSKIEQQAFRSALGLDLTISTVWELLPWSWLIDWFTNIGDILMSQRNTVPADPEMGACMTHTRTRKDWIIESVSVPTVTCTNAYAVEETKARSAFVPTPSLTAGIPLLGAGQLSILGSLIVTRKGSWR